MTIAGALAITGGIFTFAALVLGIAADSSYGRTERRLFIISGAAIALAAGCIIAAVWAAVVWIEALT